VEALDEGFPSSEIFSLNVHGRIGDSMRSYFTFDRDVTDDTVASLKRKINHDQYRGGLALDFFPRLTLGTDYGFTRYTDGNEGDEYALWSSYVFFFDPAYLRFKFNYDFKDFSYSPNPGPPLADGFGIDDHPYYSPNSYWLSEFSIYFKHQLFSNGSGSGKPRYYTLEYKWGYDSEENRLQSVAAGLLWEFKNNMILKIAGAASDLKNYKSKDLFISAAYRW
jgi:hypothetical protein